MDVLHAFPRHAMRMAALAGAITILVMARPDWAGRALSPVTIGP